MTGNNNETPPRKGAAAAKISRTAGRTLARQPSAAPDEGRDELNVLNDGLYLTGKAERAVYNRLSRLEGQVRGVKKMLAAHKSCDDMLVQIGALKQAVNGIAADLLQAHMETCVLTRVEAGEGRQAIASLRSALAKVMKHG